MIVVMVNAAIAAFARILAYLSLIGGPEPMEKIRIALKKGEATKYVGHLDFGRAIERALRRAKLPIAYSVGFNPHMKLSFGPALGVGIASEAEYVDVEVTEPIEASIFSRRLSEKLPPDLALVAAQSVNSNASLAAELNLAAYRVIIATQPTPEKMATANEAVAAFQRAESVTYIRRSPKGIKTMDLKTYVVGDIVLAAGPESFNVEFWLRMTSSGAVKPQEVIKALIDQFGLPSGELLFRRLALKAETGGGIKDAFEI